MATAPTSKRILTSDEWERVQEAADLLETAWAKVPAGGADDVDPAAFLPPVADSLRIAILHELIKTDLEIRWRRGLVANLEGYLQRFPELGTATTLPAALIYEEYYVRQRYGDQPPLHLYQSRFPQRFAELQQMINEKPVQPTSADRTSKAVPEAPQPAQSAHPSNKVFQIGSIYKLLAPLGRGAFGEVWRAEAPGGIEVAVKIIMASMAPDEAQRELQALEIVKRLRHVYLLPIHAFWQTSDQLVIAMELAGRSLRDRLDECSRAGDRGIPASELLRYFNEAAEALDYLHANYVLHCDIKPENILLFGGHAKVADFGLAKVLEQSRRLDASGGAGTPAYAAPEVFWRGRIGTYSDQYSLAVAYAETRLNRRLFSSRNPFQLMNDHLQRSPDLVPLLEAEQNVLRRALAKDPSQRYKTCSEFVAALELVAPR